MPLDPDRLADLILDAIGREIDPVRKLVKALEDRGAVPGPQGEKGMDGASGPSGKDGASGLNGADGAPGQQGEFGPIGPSGAAGAVGEKGIQGEVGPAGLIGHSGEPGRDGVDGQKGLDGKDSLPGRDGRDGLTGEKGLDGKSGVDGVNGLNGKDGLDGLGFDDLELSHDGERTVTFRWKRGDQVKEQSFVFPAVIYRGVWLDDKTYAAGDMVTRGGSTWVARSQTDATPGDGATAWLLAVKAGRQGGPGPKGEPGQNGTDGRPGKDLTSLGPDGLKW